MTLLGVERAPREPRGLAWVRSRGWDVIRRLWQRLVVVCVVGLSVGCSTITDSVVAVRDAQMTVPLAGAGNASIYLTVSASTNDGVVGASSPSCAAISLHESTTDDSGRVGMRSVVEFSVSPGQDLVLDAGGQHLMCEEADASLSVGDVVLLQLRFTSGTQIDVDMTVVSLLDVVRG